MRCCQPGAALQAADGVAVVGEGEQAATLAGGASGDGMLSGLESSLAMSGPNSLSPRTEASRRSISGFPTPTPPRGTRALGGETTIDLKATHSVAMCSRSLDTSADSQAAGNDGSSRQRSR